MSKAQLIEEIKKLEAKPTGAEPGRIWPDVSKAVKDGKAKTCSIVIRGVNANPQFTTNMYPSQFARFITQLPQICVGVRSDKLWNKFECRSPEERASVADVLDAYIKDHS
jgi:hypothetical protein